MLRRPADENRRNALPWGLLKLARNPTVKVNLSITAIVLVIVLTILAAVYRVATGPDRVRMRLDTARQTCTTTGGEWVLVGGEETCRLPAESKKI
jgi:hypothetical protein